jgi:hypothetical protein
MSVLYNIIEAHDAAGNFDEAEEYRQRVMRIAGITEEELQEMMKDQAVEKEEEKKD